MTVRGITRRDRPQERKRRIPKLFHTRRRRRVIAHLLGQLVDEEPCLDRRRRR